MARDLMHDIMEQVIEEVVVEEVRNGVPDEKLDERLSQDNISRAYKNLIEKASDDSLETIENIMYEKVLEERACTDIFLARQNQKWCKAFVTSDAMYICVLESAESYTEYVNEVYGQDICQLFHALRYIHGRALQIYLEVVCLNKNGFADGAYARWRSLYELSIIAAFIKKYGENVAKAFIKSANTEDRYEWAREADCFKDYNRKYITFSAIQNNCELATKEWKKEYNFVNQLVHASPQGTMYRLGGDTSYSLPVGRTDFGMTISAVQSAISLSQITANFFTVYSHGDSILAMVTFHKWIEKIIEYYKDVENYTNGIKSNQ